MINLMNFLNQLAMSINCAKTYKQHKSQIQEKKS